MAREIIIKIKVPTAEELDKVVKELEKMVASAIKIEVVGKEKPPMPKTGTPPQPWTGTPPQPYTGTAKPEEKPKE